MCTLTLAWQVFPDAPVVLAANRDERLDRPSEPPERRNWETPVVAPKDAEAEGTWLGYNEHGLLVTITNRWDGRDVEGARSRGLLVRDALAHESAEAAARFVERELDGRAYEGFHLLVADERAAVLVEFDGRRRVRTLDPGLHVIVNVGADGEYSVPDYRDDAGRQQAENAEAVRAALRPEPGENADGWLTRAGTVLGDHEYGVCIHGDGFGTRSSSLVRVGDRPRFEYADGPPCETSYERVTASPSPPP
jgi:YD repeat-containing protein